jgi:hypothetical protein
MSCVSSGDLAKTPGHQRIPLHGEESSLVTDAYYPGNLSRLSWLICPQQAPVGQKLLPPGALPHGGNCREDMG